VLGEVLESRYVRAVEENAKHLGLPLGHLMECAGKCVADFVAELLKSSGGSAVAVVAGRGGNAGDGFVAARHLSAAGYSVKVVCLYKESEIEHPDAAANFKLLKASGAEVVLAQAKAEVARHLEGSDVVVDAILGTGVKPPLRDPVRGAIEAINEAKGLLKVAVDIPSGLDPDAGPTGDPAVVADYTVALHYKKKCHELAPELVGKVVVCNIGIPKEAEEYTGPGYPLHLVKKKRPDAKKGDGGRVVVIGGSKEFVGAPALAALAALRAGADLVYAVVPGSIRNVVASFSPDLITVPLGGDYLDAKELGKLDKLLKAADAVAVGPGMSMEERAAEFFEGFLARWLEMEAAPPLVVDADALKLLARAKEKLKWRAVLTPHRGEFEALREGYGIAAREKLEEAVAALSEAAQAVVLLKAPVDVICEKRRCVKNRTGVPAMSKGGTGDVLAGVVAALVKKTESLFDAAAVAAYVNGRAGEEAAACLGEGMNATDMLPLLAKVLEDPLWRGECREGPLLGARRSGR